MSNLLGALSLAGAASVAGGYEISRSLRFNSADSAYLNRTPASASNRKTWTWSGWVKRGDISANMQTLFGAQGQTLIYLSDGTNPYFRVNGAGGGDTATTAALRDPSAWYHLVVAVDTTQATASNRLKMYINGVQQTSFAYNTEPTLNADTYVNSTALHVIGGRSWTSSQYLDGYLTEIHFIDGQALDPSYFGEFSTDTGVWAPKRYVGEYGTNGFFLNFSDNSGVTSTTLGKDQVGSNNWTPNGFSVTAGAGNDSLVDVPTLFGTDTGIGGEVRGNYCTFNAVKPVTNSITFSNGNLQYKPGSSFSQTTYVEGTIGVLGGSTGKYYFEMSADKTGNFWTAGVALQNNTIGSSNIGTTGSVMLYDTSKYVNGSETGSYLTSLSVNEVLGIALDTATGKVWFRDSGGFLGSGDPAAGTNEAGIPTGFSGATLVPVSQANLLSTVTANFGQRPFAYTAPSGFKALVTTNLPDPTVIEGDEYFNTVLYTGNGSTQSITGVGFQPDWVWIKDRGVAGRDHQQIDSVRGATKTLKSSTTLAEATLNSVTSFDSDGFTLGNESGANANGSSLVAWNWNAGGSTVTNTSGSISAQVRASTDAGFSIVTYTGTGAAATVGHGLGATPSMMIVKKRSANPSVEPWPVYHTSLGATKGIYLNSTGTPFTLDIYWNNTEPTSGVFSIGDWDGISTSGEPYVAYIFAAIPGYSAFGSYTGNGSTDGPFVFTGFRPAFVMAKRTDSTGFWVMLDDMRPGYNVTNQVVYANSANAESTAQATDFLSNGFKPRTTDSDVNSSGGTHVYMAFAENPFKFNLAR